MKRTWSIRARTALVFAAAAMVLAAGVVVFTNLMSISGAGRQVASISSSSSAFELSGPGASGVSAHADPSRPPTATEGAATPVAPDVGDERADLAIVQSVAVLQWQWSAVGIAGAGVVAGGVGWFVSRRMLRPIDRITETATRISASNLHERIALNGPDDELRRLSRTVDDLLDRLETAFESQRRFVAQASHELRTPLAVQRAALQIGLPDDADARDVQETRDELIEQNRRTEHIVESLLVLAEADRGLDRRGGAIDLGAVTTEVVTSCRATAATNGVDLRHAAPEHATVTGDETLVRQLVLNLVGNAIEYNEPGGFVRVTTSQRALVVENSGPVVPDEAVPELVEPFRRCPGAAESGRHSGLGLSIVASIVQAHGWQLQIAARPDGGLRVHVSLV